MNMIIDQVQGHGRFQIGMEDPWPFQAGHEEVEEDEVSLINLVGAEEVAETGIQGGLQKRKSFQHGKNEKSLRGK